MKNIVKLILVTVLISSCSARKDDPGVEYAPNMYHSVPYEPLSQVKDEEIGSWLDSNPEDGHGEFYNSNPYNPYGMTMREPVENTVKRGSHLPYRIPKDSIELAAKVKNPIESSDEVLKEAKILYESLFKFTFFPWEDGFLSWNLVSLLCSNTKACCSRR